MKSFIFILLYFVCRTAITEGQIVKGKKAKKGDFPYVVQIWQQDEDRSLCGGSIIHKRWVLTAGHCIMDKGTEVDAHSLFVIAGSQCQALGSIQNNKKYVPDNVFPYSQYNELTGDVGLLFFRKHPLPVHKLPVIQMNGRLAVEGARGCRIVGWGYTNWHDRSRWSKRRNELIERQIKQSDRPCCLKYDDVSISRSLECRNRWFFPEHNICVLEGRNGGFALGGDSGGPLVCKDGNNRDVVVGVTSAIVWEHYTYQDDFGNDYGYDRTKLEFSRYMKLTVAVENWIRVTMRDQMRKWEAPIDMDQIIQRNDATVTMVWFGLLGMAVAYI